MTSISPSKWSLSVRSDDRLLLRLKLQIRRYYYILSLPLIALHSLILCGCISTVPTIPNIFLAELRQDSTHLRLGYFGMCTIRKSSSRFECIPTILSASEQIASKLTASQQLINYAKDLQQSISFITPSLSGLMLFLGLLNLGVLQLLSFKRRPSLIAKKNQTLDKHIQNITLATRILLWASTSISLAAAHSMHSTLAVLQVAASSKHGIVEDGSIIISGGRMEAMLWSTFALSLLFNTIMQFATTSSRPTRVRRSTMLPFTKTNAEEREDSIRKITTATAQRLAVIDTRNQSSQSLPTSNINTPIYAAMTHDSPSNPNFVALNSPGLQVHAPLATLQRRPTNPTRPKPSPLSLAWPNDQQTPLSPISFLGQPTRPDRPNLSPSTTSSRRVEVRVPSEHELKQISPGLQGILMREGRGTSSIYSRPATSPRLMGKNAWV